ncbi:MAG TPA: hypothetical protein VNA69_16170 [Thermoanaerobaculia bacterium]|nr:hypothetical protein [Thermoanaerobaculia bacterium]
MQSGFRSGNRFPIDSIAGLFFDEFKRDLRFFPLLDKFWQAIREFIYERSLVCSAGYDDFVKCLSPQDTVITFNWDLCLEMALHRARHAFTLSLEQDGRSDVLQVLKPHGSVDLIFADGYVDGSPADRCFEIICRSFPAIATASWIQPPLLFRTLTYDSQLVLSIKWKAYGAGEMAVASDVKINPDAAPDVGPMQLRRFLVGEFPFLLTPAAPQALYDWSYHITRHIALKVKPSYRAIIVCGYSFPDYDAGVRKMLSALGRQLTAVPVHVVNPSADNLPACVKEDIFPGCTLHKRGFRDFSWESV